MFVVVGIILAILMLSPMLLYPPSLYLWDFFSFSTLVFASFNFLIISSSTSTTLDFLILSSCTFACSSLDSFNHHAWTSSCSGSSRSPRVEPTSLLVASSSGVSSIVTASNSSSTFFYSLALNISII
jgi:hypothetical protein